MDKQYRVPLSVAVMRYAKGMSPKGRASRSEFWWALLFSYVLHLGLSVIMGGTTLYGWLFLALMALFVFLGWRRMHDVGRPGWWCLVPFCNLYFSILPSEPADNMFGPLPNVQPIKEKPVAKKVVLGIMSLSAIVAVIGGFVGGDAHNVPTDRIVESSLEDNAEAGAQLFSALLWRAQQEQAQNERRNQWLQERRENAERWWQKLQQQQDAFDQKMQRKRQIIDDEYQRQRAREGYEMGVPKERLY